MKRSKTWLIIGLIVALLAACGGCGALMLFIGAFSGSSDLSMGRGRQVAVIEIKGVIMSGESTGFGTGSSITYSEDVIAHIEAAQEDDQIAAIVLDINSPGGGVVASADIHRALQGVDKPLVASASETAASGGYYIACAADRFVVRPATTVGSIGVILSTVNIEQLAQVLGIEQEVIKSGEFKDQGSLYRDLKPEEREMLQEMVDEAYEDFVQVVMEGRDLSEKQVRAVADGRVFSGRRAVATGFADREGNLDDAVALAGDLAGIEGEPRTIEYGREPSMLDILLSSLAPDDRPDALTELSALLGRSQRPQLQYLYLLP